MHYVLYLRWRRDDPWQGHIITHAQTSNDISSKQAKWSADVFEEQGLFFRDEDLAQAKAALLKIFLEQAVAPSSVAQ